jgi:hypothetical protein
MAALSISSNLGGLARTYEVLNMDAMTIRAASFTEKWLPLINLPTSDIEQFIKTYKKLGYSILGLGKLDNCKGI